MIALEVTGKIEGSPVEAEEFGDEERISEK